MLSVSATGTYNFAIFKNNTPILNHLVKIEAFLKYSSGVLALLITTFRHFWGERQNKFLASLLGSIRNVNHVTFGVQ